MQTVALKELLRAEAEAKETARAQAEAMAGTAARWESNAKNASMKAQKAQTELDMLEGVLQTVQASCSVLARQVQGFVEPAHTASCMLSATCTSVTRANTSSKMLAPRHTMM